MPVLRADVRDPLSPTTHKHVPIRWLLAGAVLCAVIVVGRAGQLKSNFSELHVSPPGLATSTVYQDAVRRCQRMLPVRRHLWHWCGQLAYVPIWDSPPSIAHAASEAVALFADPAHGVNANPNLALDWQWNYVTGLWGGHDISHWWESAMAMRTLMRYLEVTRNADPGFHTILMRTYTREIRNPFAIAQPNFVNLFGDDTAWWGLAWLDASKYELNVRHDVPDAGRFLKLAQYDANYLATQPKACGGVAWKTNNPPDTITGAEYATLTAELYQYTNSSGSALYDPTASRWLTQARSTISWLERTGLIDIRLGRVRDSLNPTCKQLLAGPLTYTQGQVAEALVEVGAALHNPSYYQQAAGFLRFVLSKHSGMTNPSGILQEPCERSRDGCTGEPTFLDIISWKGILIEGMSDFTTVTGSTEFVPFLRRQAEAVVHNAISRGDGTRTSPGHPGNCSTAQTCQFVFYWGWPLDSTHAGVVNQSTQMDGIDALTAALALPPGA